MTRQLAVGISGQLRYGYHLAASLGDWRIDELGDQLNFQWVLTATIISKDDFWFDPDRLFTLRLDIGKRQWEWTQIQVALEMDNRIVVRGKVPPSLL